MAALASHELQKPFPVSPEVSGAETMGQGLPAEAPADHDYGIYVLEGAGHKDGSSGLIFAFNPNVLPLKDKDTQQIARNVRLSLLPLKHKEEETIAGSKDVTGRGISFRVEANESPVKVIENGKFVEDDSEKYFDTFFGDYEQEDDFTVMRGWPAIRLDYDTSLIDQPNLIKAVGYVLASRLPAPDRELWIQDMSSGINVERLLDPEAVKPGNPNLHVRNWLKSLLSEEQAANEASDNPKRRGARFRRIAASISSLIKV